MIAVILPLLRPDPPPLDPAALERHLLMITVALAVAAAPCLPGLRFVEGLGGTRRDATLPVELPAALVLSRLVPL